MTKDLTIKEILTMWGRWVNRGGTRQCPVNIGYKSVWDSLLPSCGGGVEINDDELMLRVSKSMRVLKDKSPFDYKLLKLKYKYGYSYKRIAQKLTKQLPQYQQSGTKMCDKYCKKLVDLAENTIEMHLNSGKC